jgi:hypothetical protein
MRREEEKKDAEGGDAPGRGGQRARRKRARFGKRALQKREKVKNRTFPQEAGK